MSTTYSTRDEVIERETTARNIVPGERVKHKGLTLTRSIEADQYGWPAFEVEGKPGVSITLCPSQLVELV